MNFLTHIDSAKREILAADSLVKVKDLWNKSDAMRALGQAAKDPELVNYATEFKLRCERRLGEMLRPVVRQGQHGRESRGASTFTLTELGLTKDLSSRAQKIAAVPEEKFEAALATAREEEQQITRRTLEFLTSGHNHRAQGTGENEWYTPKKYLDMARAVLGEIDLDPASSDKANETVGARRFFSKNDDGLSQPWGGKVWLNPPYSQPDITDFSKKLLSEIKTGRVTEAIALTHNYTDTEFFHLLANSAAALCFPRGRIGFVDPSGAPCAPTQGQAFFYFGPQSVKFGTMFSETGVILCPA